MSSIIITASLPLLTFALIIIIIIIIPVDGLRHDAKPALMELKLYRVTEKPLEHGEAPTWDSRKNFLYFVDLHRGIIYCYHYLTGELNHISVNGEVAPIIPSRSYPELLIVGVNRSLVALEWNGKKRNGKERIVGKYRVLTTISRQFPNSRFNDGKADSQGRLWFGTMGYENASGVVPNQGVLYKFSKAKIEEPEVVLAPVTVSNGLTWNRANNRFYYIDSPTRQIHGYDYSDELGVIINKDNPKIVFDLNWFRDILTGVPDGMTCDQSDRLWIALYNGGAIIQVDPVNGQLLKIVRMPVMGITSVIWGGPNMDTLFITTSQIGLDRNEKLLQPLAGYVFAIEGLGVKGAETYYADIVDFI